MPVQLKMSNYENTVEHSLKTPTTYEIIENAAMAIFYDCDPDCTTYDYDDDTLMDYTGTFIMDLDYDIAAFITNVVHKIYGNFEDRLDYDAEVVSNNWETTSNLLKKMGEYTRDNQFFAEGKTETNGHDSVSPFEEKIEKAFAAIVIEPEEKVFVDLSKDEISLKTEEEDFFDFQSHVHKITNRYCHHRDIKCPCMYTCRYKNPDNPFAKTKAYQIDEVSYRDLCAINSELPTCIVSPDPRKEYKDHFVVKIALTTADKNIRSSSSRSKEEVMKQIYRLRSYYIDELPPQMKLNYEKFVAEDEDDSITDGLMDKIKRAMMTTGKCIMDSVNAVVDIVKRMVSSVSEFISDSISKLLEKLFTKLSAYVIDQFDVDAFIKQRILKLKDDALTGGRKVAFALIVIIFLIALELLSFFVFRFATKIIMKFVNLFADNDCFDIRNTGEENVAEGMGPLTSIATIACAGFGLTTGDTKSIKEKCDFFNSLVRAGSGIALTLGSLFVLLPTVFKDTMTLAWGSPEEKDVVICEDWIIRSTCVLRLSKIAQILASQDMHLWIKEQIGIAPELIKKVSTAAYKTLILRIYSDLMRISMNLEQYHHSDNSRDVPYSIHLSAQPGFGKSLLAPVLISKAFDFATSEIYTRNQTEEYWSGYIAQAVVFIDEFLVNKDSNVANRSADEYLKLISPSKFTPEFASTDNIVMGLKGTSVSPKIVMTANNEVYSNVTGFQPGAMDRRRRFVIKMKKNPAHKQFWSGTNTIDLSKMTHDDLNNAEWLTFDIMNSYRTRPIALHSDMSFRELIVFLKDDYQQHLSDCEKIGNAFRNGATIEEDPTAKLTEMMAEMKGAPKGRFDYDNPLSNLLSGFLSFFSEGNDTDVYESAGSHPDAGQVTIEDDDDSDDPIPVPTPRLINRDIAPEPYCTNIDRDRMHRHLCMCCTKHSVVRRCEGDLVIRCSQCELKKRKIPIEKLRQLALSEPLLITPEEMETIREKRKEEMRKLLVGSRFTYILSGENSMPMWTEFIGFDDLDQAADNIKRVWKSRAKMFAGIITIYLFVIYVRRLLNKDAKTNEPGHLEFIPESPTRVKTTTPKQKDKRAATNWRGEATSYAGLKYYLNIGGEVLGQENGMPVSASKFITHRHSLLDASGNLYTHGNMTVYYKDGMDTIPYDVNMIREFRINDRICDFVMVCLPPRMKINGFPNIINKFWRDEDLAKFVDGDVCIVQPDGSTRSTRAGIQRNKNYRWKDHVFHISTALTYAGVSNGPGWCGLMLESYGNICPGQFIGMHVAGSGTKGRSDGLYGLAIPITREMIEQLLNYQNDSVIPEDIVFNAESGPFFGPGLVSVESLNSRERIMLSRVSKIKPSAIVDELPFAPKKHLPLLSPMDERANGEDPLVNMINDTLSVEPPACDQKRADRALVGTMHHMRKNLSWVFPKRRLTFEEAVGGIPGLLTSMNRNTSAGYPLCKITKGQGKKEYFWFNENGELRYDPLFKELVLNFVDAFDRGECQKGRFVAYLKDELVSEKKIKQKRCRIIYGGDMIANTAFRMIFGSFVIAYNNSYDKLTHVVGLNQYSYDMDLIHAYLTEVGDKFVAGDFKGWDKNMCAYIQKKVYFMIMQICASLIDPKNCESFYEHQVKSPVIVEKHLLWFLNTQFSGCFFTTILNCLVHDAMLRYIFDLIMEAHRKHLVFEEHVRAKILGDDHIYCFSDEAAEFMNPITIQNAYKEIGAVYTDDLKEAEMTADFRSFESLTFLGAHPKKVDGLWVGALKKDSIYEMVLWTRSFNEDLAARCLTAVEMSSVWGEDFYLEFSSLINDALRRKNYPLIDVKPWLVMIHDVANRTAASQQTYPRYIAEGNEGLVNLNARNEVHASELNKTTLAGTLRGKAVAEIPQDLAFGLESTVYRDSFEWRTSDIAGVAIKKIDVPFGLLNLGDSDNVQNMPFDRFLFWNGDVVLTFQVNGTPFMCGMLAIYFMPLASYEAELANVSTTNHVYLQPDQNNTVELRIPFIYFRTVMNTVARTTESLGTIFVTPMSPLSNIDGSNVTITLYSSFPGSKFSIPRPLPVQSRKAVRYYTTVGVESSSEVLLPTQYVAEGASQSTNITNSYTNVGGTMPVSDVVNTATPDLDFAADVKADMKIPVGLDNPPLASGALPVELAYPGFSNSYGVRPTRDLQLMPATFARQQCMIFDPAETRIDVNCMRPCLLTTIPLSTSMVPNTSLMELSLDSRLNIAIGSGVPVNLAVLNQFHFWRGDIEFTFAMVRTQYHSCRLQGVVAYGVNSIEPGSRSVAFSNVMDFSSDNSVCSMKIEYNAQTEFLRTYEGSEVVDPLQNHSLGTFGLFITNQLVAPETVPQTIELLVFVRFLNVKVATPRAFSPFTWNGYGEIEANNKTDLPLNSLPQALFEESYPPWAVTMAEDGFLPVLGTVPSGIVPGIYTASGEVSFALKETNARTWISSVSSVKVDDDLNIGVVLNNASVQYIFPDRSGLLVSTPVLWNTRWAGWSVELVDKTISIYVPISPTFFAEGVDEGEDLTQTDEVVPSDTTHASEERPSIVHKVEPMQKFEFCPSDITEIGRRYVRVEFLNNPNLDQRVKTTEMTNTLGVHTMIHAATQLSSMWRGLFSAWAGSIKYRLFTSESDYLEVLFQPFFNAGDQFSISAGDVIRGSVVTSGTTVLTADTSVVGPYAREMGFPSWHRQYVDVSVPFQSHFNFLFTSKTQEIAPISSGTITLSGATSGEEIKVFSAFGDDLRLGVYRPPRQTRFSLSAYIDGINGFWSAS
nr:MAG: polyprotein [Basavirus sp.]